MVMKDMTAIVFMTCMIPLSFSSSSCRLVVVVLSCSRTLRVCEEYDEGVPLYSTPITVEMWYPKREYTPIPLYVNFYDKRHEKK